MQKIVDQQGRRARKLRISVTDRCQMRCTYCMPEEGKIQFVPASQLLSYEEIVRFVKAVCGAGIQNVRITGGEPLLRRDLHLLVAQLAAIPAIKRIALTTNGLLLPGKAEQLIQAGLTDLTISLDTLQRDRMQALTRGDHLETVLQALELAAAMPLQSRKVNTVLIRNINDDEILSLLAHSQQLGLEHRFIEYMPFEGQWKQASIFPAAELVAYVQQHLGPVEALDHTAGSTSLRYRITKTGQVFGIIPTVSQPLCSECDRLRLTATGTLLGCLFATEGPDIRPILRNQGQDTDKHLLEAAGLTYQQRGPGFLAQLQANESADVPERSQMFSVGG